MQTITIKGKEYELTSEPVHGIVREIRKKQKKLSVAFVMKYRSVIESVGDKATIQETMMKIAEVDPEGMSEYNDSMEEFIEVSVVSLATGKLWVPEDFFDIKDSEFTEILIKCREAIGGGAADFFGVSTSNSPPKQNVETKQAETGVQPSSET